MRSAATAQPLLPLAFYTFRYYTFNAFFMTMRGKFTAPGTSIHYYCVEFDPASLSWADFRGQVSHLPALPLTPRDRGGYPAPPRPKGPLACSPRKRHRPAHGSACPDPCRFLAKETS